VCAHVASDPLFSGQSLVRAMPRRGFMKRRTCHGCGLESADDCPQKHVPFDSEKEPCMSCLRNPEVQGALEEFMRTNDFYNEAWTLDTDGKPFIER